MLTNMILWAFLCSTQPVASVPDSVRPDETDTTGPSINLDGITVAASPVRIKPDRKIIRPAIVLRLRLTFLGHTAAEAAPMLR